MTKIEEFIQRPTDSSNNHVAYADSFLNIGTAPEYVIGEVILASAYRNIGWKNSNSNSRYSEASIFNYGGLSDGLPKKIEKDIRIDTKLKIFENKTFNEILRIFLNSPKMKNQEKSKNLVLYPLVPDTALYSSAARMRGNPWNPGKLLEETIICGCTKKSDAEIIWSNLFRALNSDPSDEREDIWARVLTKEFKSWREPELIWGDYSNEISKTPYLFYTTECANKTIPATQFVKDLSHVIELKSQLTRKQWISILESLLRIGCASHLLWICRVNYIIWEYFLGILKGDKIDIDALSSKIFERNIIDLRYEENINNAVKKHAREYVISRVGTNLLLYQLGNCAPQKIHSLKDVLDLGNLITKNKENISTPEILNQELSGMLEKDPKLLNCTKGIGNNIYEFIRYSLGQKKTAEDSHKSFDQGYWLKKKGDYSAAPWVLEMGPAAILLMVYCETKPYNYSRTISNLCEHMAMYGISINPKDVTNGKLANRLRSLGLVTDSPDAEGGMVINKPF